MGFVLSFRAWSEISLDHRESICLLTVNLFAYLLTTRATITTAAAATAAVAAIAELQCVDQPMCPVLQISH